VLFIIYFFSGFLHVSDKDIENDVLLCGLKEYAIAGDLGSVVDNPSLIVVTRLFLLTLIKHTGLNPFKR
jgi:hypothetical protein